MTALERLCSPGAQEDELFEYVRKADGAMALASFQHYLSRLSQRGFILRSANYKGERIATELPVSGHFTLNFGKIDCDRRYVLSRFAYLRREDEELALESPLSHARIILHNPRCVVLIHALAKPRSPLEMDAIPSDLATMLMSLLLNNAMLQQLNTDVTEDDESTAVQSWHFGDLLFHSRTRAGFDDSYKNQQEANVLSSGPALKLIGPGEAVELYRPDLDKLQREDPPFACVQEMRRSVRTYSSQPITARQLGEFLYRVARVTEVKEAAVNTTRGSMPLTIALRPYPSGGALYELELYVAINKCEGLPRGLRYYDPLNHRLCEVSPLTPDVQKLLTDAAVSAQIPSESLQVLLVVSARFRRIGWKYTDLAYSLILKNVGVIYQTMYLAATAMGLAPCALGCGDAQLFSRAAGADYYAESSVGEFLLGNPS